MDMVTRYKDVKELSELLSISRAEASKIIGNVVQANKNPLTVN